MSTTPRGTWCDGLEGYLLGSAEWPSYMNSRLVAVHVIDPTGSSIHAPLVANDRIYFMHPGTNDDLMVPSWAVEEIMKALGEGRRVQIYGPAMESVAALCDIVGFPLPGWLAEGEDAPPKPN